MIDRSTALFSEHRDHLVGVAYRMLGSMAEAEDVVQDAYRKWRRVSVETVREPRAWLVTTVSRLCLNVLKSARVKRLVYVGPWLPEPVVTDAPVDRNSGLADSLSYALLVVLESLNPTERAVFVLREVFDHDFAQIAEIVGKSESNCRQILSRARARVMEKRPRFDVASEQRDAAFESFAQAARTGDVAALMNVLADDVKFTTDGGGRARALPVALAGAQRVARIIGKLAERVFPDHRVFREAEINGLPGLVSIEHGKVVSVVALGISEGRVSRIYVVTNPEKLARLHDLTKGGGRR